MAADNIIGIAFEMDVEDLKTGLNETKKAITTAGKEFREVSSQFEDWTQHTEGLNAKLKQLDTVLINQKKNVKGYEAAIQQATEAHGENSEEVRKLKDGLLDAKAAVNKTKLQIDKYSNALDDLKNGNNDASKSTDKLSRSFKTTRGESLTLKGAIGVLSGAIGGLLVASVTKLVSGLQNAVNESRQFRREMAYLEAAADATGVSFDEAKEHVKEVTSITADQGAAIEGLNNLMTAGFKGDALDKITDQLIGAAIQWKDTLKFEGLADSLQETLTTGTGTGQFIELLERCGIVADDFNMHLQSLSTQAERQDYVLQVLASTGLADVKNSFMEANKPLIESELAMIEYNEALAAVGAKAEPVMTTIKTGFLDILDSFLTMENGTNMEGYQQSIKDTFSWFIETCVPVIKDAISFVMAHKEAVLGSVIALGAAFLTWKVAEIISSVIAQVKNFNSALHELINKKALDTSATTANTISLKANIKERLQSIAALVKHAGSVLTQKAAMVAEAAATKASTASQKLHNSAVITSGLSYVKATASLVAHKAAMIAGEIATKAVTAAQWLLNAAMNANPITLIITAIGLLVTAFVTLWNTSESFREFWIGLWEKLKELVSGAVESIVGFFTGLWDRITGIWNKAGEYFRGIINTIIGFFTEIPQKMLSIGSDIIDGLIDGIKGAIGKIGDAVKSVGDSIVGGIKGILGIHSPSAVMRDEVGAMVGEGVGEGITASLQSVLERIYNLAGMIKDALTSSLEGLSVGLDSLIETSGLKGVTDSLQVTVASLKELFLIGWVSIAESWSAAGPFFTNLWYQIYTLFSQAPAFFRDAFTKAWVNVQKAWAPAVPFFNGIYNSIWSRFAGLPSTFYSLGINMMQGLINGVNAKIAEAERVLAECARKTAAAAKAQLKIQSPSKVMYGIGENIVLGMAEGIARNAKHAVSRASSLAGNLTSTFQKIGSIQPPKIDISGLKSSGGGNSSTVTNHNYYQTINAPKSPSRLELYRQTKNLLALR